MREETEALERRKEKKGPTESYSEHLVQRGPRNIDDHALTIMDPSWDRSRLDHGSDKKGM